MKTRPPLDARVAPTYVVPGAARAEQQDRNHHDLPHDARPFSFARNLRRRIRDQVSRCDSEEYDDRKDRRQKNRARDRRPKAQPPLSHRDINQSVIFCEAFGCGATEAVRVGPKVYARAHGSACLVPSPRARVRAQEGCVLGPTVR